MSILYYATSRRAQDEPSNKNSINGLRIPITDWSAFEPFVGVVLVSPDEITDPSPWTFEISLTVQPSQSVLARSSVLTIEPTPAISSQPDRVEYEMLVALRLIEMRFTKPGGYELVFTVNGNIAHAYTVIVEQG